MSQTTIDCLASELTKKNELFELIYPINSIYLSFSHINPHELFGGTWERINNTFLWCCDGAGEIGRTGGESSHTLTDSELPSHFHAGLEYSNTGRSIALNSGAGSGYALSWSGTAETVDTEIRTARAGANAAHNNMPPFIQISAWRRTA